MNRIARYFWVIPLAVALAWTATDSAARLRSIRMVSESHFQPVAPLERDSLSASGYTGNKHRVVLPVRDMDGYHWVMQTESMLKNGGWRVRHADYDGPPGGREVHWAGLVRWWAAAFAAAASAITGESVVQSLESVFPWVNTAFFALVLLALTPLIARRCGSLSASLFAITSVTLFQSYETYAVGNFDHHGVLATCALLTSLCVVAGGAGWVKVNDAALQKVGAERKALWEWLPTERIAKQWFVASGVAGGVGLWISAASQAPVTVGVGIAGFLCTGVLGRDNRDATWRTAPRLWRTWGIAGAATSAVLFALEYFPSSMSMRLEVNHPLYALALFGAGDLLYRLCLRMRSEERPADIRWIAIDMALIAALPVFVLAVPDSFVLRVGTLLLTLHEENIQEFNRLTWQLGQWNWAQINAGIGIFPLLMLFPTALIVGTRKFAAPIRALVLGAATPAFIFTLLALRHVRWLGIALTLWIAALIAIATVAGFGLPSWNWQSAKKIFLGFVIALPTAILPIVLAYNPPLAANIGMPLAVLFVGVVAFAAIQPALALTSHWDTKRLIAAGVFLGLVTLPHPVATLYNWTRFGWRPYPTAEDVTQLATRELSWMLRDRLGAQRGTILAGPTTSTWMTYYGGFRTIGTLYWENGRGIEAAAAIFGAPSADSARKLIEANEITHIVLPSWDHMADNYALLSLRMRGGTVDGMPGTFARQLLTGVWPSWLRQIPYAVPPMTHWRGATVLILEVAPLR